MFVKVFKLGEEDSPLTTFPVGAHILGRGALQCNDKRISRNHATIEVTASEVKLTANHINPCFLKIADSKTLTVLRKDSAAQLNDGDTFAFLPDDFWFKIRTVEDNLELTENKNEAVDLEQTVKRHLDTSDEAAPDKRIKIEAEYKNEGSEIGQTEEIKNEESNDNKTHVHDTENSLGLTQLLDNLINDVADETNNITEASTDNNLHIEEANESDQEKDAACDTTSNLPQDEEITSSHEEQEETGEPSSEKADDGTNPGTSNPKPKREKCWYGAECYRKNPIHRQEFTHPGDSDFESDPDDKRPVCSFGAQCYRKNKSHRKSYKHPPREPPGKKKRVRKKVDRLNVADSEEISALDLSDSEDPFIADDDSDEDFEDTDEDDSDFEDSQNVEEDSENIKRLIKEAKRYIKN
jgi:hypothetical protein